jgi:sulfate adenylyltransferase small subunit
MREVITAADNPVILYSIGKDSSVMLHLARKAFFQAPPPLPLLHVDTTWKFRDMYRFRDRMVKEVGMRLLVHVNHEGLAQGIGPFTHGSAIHTDVMKTQALKQALDTYAFDAALGGARRDEEKSRAKERIFSFRSAQHFGTRKTNVQSYGGCITRKSTRANQCASSRSRTGPNSMSGTISISKIFRSYRCILPRRVRSWNAMAR